MLVALSLFALAGATIPAWLTAMPFAVSLVFCGMPHGAVDWHINRRVFRARSTAGALVAFVPYTAVCIACLVLLLIFTRSYLITFFLLSVVHFGRSDARARTGLGRPGGFESLRGSARASTVVLLPFATQPEETTRVLSELSRAAGGAALIPPTVTLVFAVLGLGGALFWLLDALRLTVRVWASGMALLFVIVLSHAALPPLLSVGIWFLLWHALRECVRLGGHDRAPWPSILHTHRRSLALMIPTFALISLLLVAFDRPVTLLTVALLTILFYAVFTPAHHTLQEIDAPRETWPSVATGEGSSVARV
ncbi:MAG: Brp/Blh family beta-carotene 15,15'-dioxygenase [Phycisphaerales bacterium]